MYMTDLTNIWSEHLSRENILKRAEKDAATIDPNEDQEQYQVLLRKIGDALRNETDTNVYLGRKSSGDTLELTTSTKLPAPLEPLEWSAYLSREPQSSLTHHLLLPMLKAEAGWESRQRNLMDQLNRKDWVLDKLFDKIEAMGVDLSTIFPGISGLRTRKTGTTQAHAAKYIKGIAPFDEHAWLEEQNSLSPDLGLPSNILAELSNADTVRQSELFHPPPDKWWEGLAALSHATLPRHDGVDSVKDTMPPKDDTATETDSGAETDDDDFERQETPPRFKHPKDTEENPPDSRDTQKTDSEPSETSPSPARAKSPMGTSKGLGVIGGQKSSRKLPQSTHIPSTDTDETDSGSDLEGGNATSPAPAARKPLSTNKSAAKKSGLGVIGGSSEVKQGLSRSTSPELPPKPQAQDKTPTKPRGLGVIGGKKREKQRTPATTCLKSPEPLQSDSITHSTLPKTKTKPAGKLGVIGGKGTKHIAVSTSSTPSVSPRPEEEAAAATAEEDIKSAKTAESKEMPVKSPPPKSPQPDTRLEEPKQEETEQERANRKREELKRQLEAKSKAPAKKKRRF
ncbi:hypothetical protein EYZ11_007908 [Aspergillus tanneri]|uniref:Non-homologous end-joining factor 1 n=1 Tax=Aspergillus tanneri TaxID=1220188 RepID=A0A4S3JBT8_9EURO|nr:hypothetical protein EYZ11_007908 [Aspergillus tanneri]